MKGKFVQALKDRGYWLAVAGGVAGALAFDPVKLRFLIPIAPLCCFLVVRWAQTPGAAARRAFVFGWVYFFGAISWLCSLYQYNGFAPFGIMIGAGYMALYPALGAWLARKWFWPRNVHVQFWSFASFWIFGEYIRTLGRLAAPFAQLGHAWAPIPLLIQNAAVLGELGITLLVFLCAWWLFYFLNLFSHLKFLASDLQAERKVNPAAWVQPLKIGCTASIVWILITVVQYTHAYAETNPDSYISHAIIAANFLLLQPNIDQPTKLASYSNEDEEEAARIREYMTQTQEKLLARDFSLKPDLIIFPESSFTDPHFNYNRAIQERISVLAKRTNACLLVGGDRETRYEVYNSMYLVGPDGTWETAVYDKMRLVPFGEDVPYLSAIPGVQSVVGIGSFNMGHEQTIFTLDVRTSRAGQITQTQPTRSLKFGGLICFESAFASMARGLARRGADFICVVTNDGWYGRSAGAAQHHHLSQLRAVETRRWVLRCANTGISSVIAPSGEVVQTLGLMEKGTLEATIHFDPNPPTTLFVRFGYLWLWAVAAYLGLCFYWGRKNV